MILTKKWKLCLNLGKIISLLLENSYAPGLSRRRNLTRVTVSTPLSPALRPFAAALQHGARIGVDGTFITIESTRSLAIVSIRSKTSSISLRWIAWQDSSTRHNSSHDRDTFWPTRTSMSYLPTTSPESLKKFHTSHQRKSWTRKLQRWSMN